LYFGVRVDAFTCPTVPPETVRGLCVFSKKVILFGSEGSVKVFSSEFLADDRDTQLPPVSTRPKCSVQIAEPIVLNAKVCRPCDCHDSISDHACGIPRCIQEQFDGDFDHQSFDKAVKVTIGLFSIVLLTRNVQMLIPAYEFCMPTKECTNEAEEPCDVFKKIDFPVNEFFPPEERRRIEDDRNREHNKCCEKDDKRGRVCGCS